MPATTSVPLNSAKIPVAKKGDNVKVVIRIRPENEFEKHNEKSRVIVVPAGESVLTFDPKEIDPFDYFHGKARKHRDINKRENKDVTFAFDRVFDEFTTNEDVYKETTATILESLLGGYNCSVFAYGATGSGKTFSMLGNEANPGVIYLTMVDLYRRIEEMKEDKTCEIKVSYLEVYNELIRDLLPQNQAMKSGDLPLREDPRAGVIIKGLSLHEPKTVEELIDMLKFGNENRTQHPTDANAESSRSHAVFQVFVRLRPRTAGVSTNVQTGKMSLIDLAGSERATATRNRGKRFNEGANINQSLLALGNVINALADSKIKNQHVPYRNSKLTRLLKDSLGGNCKTVMIAAVSPSSLTYDDTHNTLKYADRAKRIKTNLKKNEMNVGVHISRYSKVIDDLRVEIKELKSKLETQESVVNLPAVPLVNLESVCNLQDVLHHVFIARIGIQKEVLEFESCEREIGWKIACKQSYINRYSVFCGEAGKLVPVTLAPVLNADVNRIITEAVGYNPVQTTNNSELNRMQHFISASETRLRTIDERKICVKSRLKDNIDWLRSVEKEALEINDDGIIPEILSENLRTHHLEVELIDSKRYIKHLKKMLRSYELERQNDDTLITSLLSAVKKQRSILSGHNWVTFDLEESYNTISKMVLNNREVAWADSADHSVKSNVVKFTDLPILSCVRASPCTPARKRKNQDVGGNIGATPKTRRSVVTNRSDVVIPHVNENTNPGLCDLSRLSPESGNNNRLSVEFAGHTPFVKKLLVTEHSPGPVTEHSPGPSPAFDPDLNLDQDSGNDSSDSTNKENGIAFDPTQVNNRVPPSSIDSTNSTNNTIVTNDIATNDQIVVNFISASPIAEANKLDGGTKIKIPSPNMHLTAFSTPINANKQRSLSISPSQFPTTNKENISPSDGACVNVATTSRNDTLSLSVQTPRLGTPISENMLPQRVLVPKSPIGLPQRVASPVLHINRGYCSFPQTQNTETPKSKLANMPQPERVSVKKQQRDILTCTKITNSVKSKGDKPSVNKMRRSATVSKLPAPKDNTNTHNNENKNAMRTLHYDDEQSPSFADIVKSTRSPLQQMNINALDGQDEGVNVSPKMSLTSETCDMPSRLAQGPQFPHPQKSFSIRRDSKARKNMMALRQAGLPSMVDEAHLNGSSKPNYMQMTKAATRKATFDRSVSSRDIYSQSNKGFRRQMSTASLLPQPSQQMKSSKSSTNLRKF